MDGISHASISGSRRQGTGGRAIVMSVPRAFAFLRPGLRRGIVLGFILFVIVWAVASIAITRIILGNEFAKHGVTYDLGVDIVGDFTRAGTVLAALGVLAATVAAVVVTRTILRPLRSLTAGLEAVASGHLDVKLEVSSDDEIGRIALFFNQLSANLKNSLVELDRYFDSLETKVAERTTALKESNDMLVDEIRERKAAEDALQRSHDFSRTVLDSMNDAIAILDVNDCRIVDANSIFLAETGLAKEEAIGRRCFEVTHRRATPCEAPHDRCPLSEMLGTGGHASAEHVHFGPNGEKKFIEVWVSPIRDESGSIVQAIHVSRDVTERKWAMEEVIRSTREYKNLVDTIYDAVYRTDENGVFTLMNPAGARIFGFERPDEMIGRQAQEFWQDTDDRVAFLAAIREQKTVSSYLIPAITKTGASILLEATSRVREDEDGTFRGIEGIIRDVTERIEAERRLKAKQQELERKHEELSRLFSHVEAVKKEWERTMDCSGDIMILADPSGRIKRCNRALKEFTGKEYEEILWKEWEEVLQENGMVPVTFFDQEYEFLHPATGRSFTLNSYPFRDEKDPNVAGQVIVVHDVTEIRKVGRELEQKNREIEENRFKLQRALDEISSLIQQVVRKKDISVRFANPNIAKCYDAKSCDKKDCPCYGAGETRCWQIAGTYCGGKVQGKFAEKYANCVECDVFRAAIPDPIYEIGEYFNNMMHILELKNRELEHAYTDLKSAQSQVLQQEKMASIGQLAAGVAHEINNPIGFISSNLGTLRKYAERLREFIGLQEAALDTLSGAEQVLQDLRERKRQLKLDHIVDDTQQLIAESLDGADRVKKIVQDLKGFSRVDEAEQKMADLNAGIESTINIVWNELKYKATVRKELGDIPRTRCNLGQLNQVFMNMLVNAAHAIEKQGEIGVRTWAENGSILVSVSDTGCGIPPDKVNRIFEPFFTTKEVGKGTGLGLSIAYDIVKKHKGEITVDSVMGTGTTFTVRIPVVQEKSDG